MSDVLEMEILTELKESKYFPIMFDETIDVSTIEQMVIHARYIDKNGKIVTRFLKILDCLDQDMDEEVMSISLNADKISQKVTRYIKESGLSYEKLVGIGTDGAAVMVGSKNGAVKKIIDSQIAKQKGKKWQC